MTWLEGVDAGLLEQALKQTVAFSFAETLTYEELGHELVLQAGETEQGFALGGRLWERVKNEFHLLVCEKTSKYDDTRKKLNELSGQSTNALVALISGSLGAAIGTAALVIAPIVMLLLLATVRIGIEVFCAARNLDQPIVLKS